MAPIAAELSTLRSITYRISSASTSQLPQQVPSVAAKLTECKALLSSNHASGPKTSSEASVTVHKYRTLLSTLLQDRTVQGRWAAVVLIKATVETGGWETLQKSLPWVRGLLGILTKPDPPSSKRLCIITLTRIFTLTREYPTLIREITTPSLPTFVQTSLQMASSAPATLLQTILESFNQLLPRHPTIFRSYLKQLNQLLTRTIAPTPSSKLGVEQESSPAYAITSEVCIAARQLYTQLPNCAPKGASNEEWQASLKETVENAHRVADKVFRAVLEDWKLSTTDKPSMNGHTLEDEVQDLNSDDLALAPWSGIYAGGERLVNLLRLIETYMLRATAGPVNLNAGAVVELLMRFLSLNVPSFSGNKDHSSYVRFNNQVSKEERENLWAILPDVHVAAVEVFLAISRRGIDITGAIDTIMLDQLVMLFSSEKNSPQIRIACYLGITRLLERSGMSLPKSSVEPLGPIIRACCDDILPVEQNNTSSNQTPQPGKANGNSQQALTNADTFLSSSNAIQNPAAQFKGLEEAASSLLVALYSGIPHHLSDSLRTRMDRTAILTRSKDAMLSSCMNVTSSKKFGKPAASVLPLLARLFAGERDVEALVRPRMPVIRRGGQSTEEEDGGEEESEGESEGNSEEEQDGKDEVETFVGHELDTLLETATKTGDSSGDLAMSEGIDQGAAPTMDTPLNESGDSGTYSPTIQDAGRTGTASTSKRPQEVDAPLSPSKRIKVAGNSPPNPPPSSAIPTMVSTTQTAAILATPKDAIAPHGTAAPSTNAQAGESDDDDEDIVPLVFGQDTDDESE